MNVVNILYLVNVVVNGSVGIQNLIKGQEISCSDYFQHRANLNRLPCVRLLGFQRFRVLI